MRRFVLVAAIVVIGTGMAQSQNNKVSFSNLSTVSADGDVSVCQTRYGNGYTTSIDPDKSSAYRTSDKGHTIHIVRSKVEAKHGVFVMQNEYSVGYPGSDEQSDAHLYATALDRNGPYSGVFSDGTCRGNVTLARQ